MKILFIALLMFGCSKTKPVEVPDNFTGRTCAYGVVIIVTDTGIYPSLNNDGTPERCAI